MLNLRALRWRERARILAWQVGIVGIVLVSWEMMPDRLLDPYWFSRPLAISRRLLDLMASGDLWPHIAATIEEMGIGLAIGAPLGTLTGVAYGSARRLRRLINFLVVAVYSLPLVALSPLFILWFGLGMSSKAALVAVVAFWLMFLTISASMSQIDKDLVESVRQLGGEDSHVWRWVRLPSVLGWFFSGIKICLPYGLAAAVVGEMMASNEGLGFLVLRASQLIRMDSLFALIIVVVMLGVGMNGMASIVERKAQRWKTSA